MTVVEPSEQTSANGQAPQQSLSTDEYRPGLNVRFMGISEQTAILVPDALALPENVEIGRRA